MKPRGKEWLYAGLVLLGLIQAAGFLTQSRAIRGIGIATCSSPLPIVFTSVKGLETFSSSFYLRFRDRNGNPQIINITPEIYSELSGPYNYRNVIGAAFAYGPVMEDELRNSVYRFAFCEKEIYRDMGIDYLPYEFQIGISALNPELNREFKFVCKP